MNKLLIICTAFLTVAAASVMTSCSDNRSTGLEFARNMYDPIAYNPDQPNNNFKDGKTAQTPPAGTTPVGFDKNDVYPNTIEGYESAGKSLSNPLPVTIPTLEGPMRASVNDYIIKGIQGEFYPCKPDIFELTYDIVK